MAATTTTPAAALTRDAGIAHALIRETTLAPAALLMIALHVIDDSFLQPQPGTSAGDHLLSGLVPVAVLLVVAATYGRLRAGVRASLAAGFGLFGVAAGIEAVYYAHSGRASGDDYTGFLSLVAGLLLLGTAAVTLWRSKRGGHPLWRWARRGLIAVGTVITAYFLLGPFLLSYVLTHTARAFVPVDRVGAAHENVSFTTSDGLRLRGWYVPSRNGAAVIAFPGRKGSQKPARFLAAHGYGVLLFDRRGEGESEGDPNAWGWNGYRDVDAAVAFLRRRPDVEPGRIGGIGLSVGGEMMLEAAARSRGLDAMVSEGAGERSLREFLDATLGDKWFAAPQYATITAGVSLFTDHGPPPSLKDLAAKIATPVFFIYGEHGQEGERNLTPQYFAAAPEPKQIWEVPDSGHVGGIEARPRQYVRRVTAFFDRTLLN